MAKLKTAVLISGRGSNLQALIDACAGKDYPAELALVLSNETNAQGLARAHEAGVASKVIDHRDFPDRESFEAELTAAIEASGADLVCLAGFMRLLTASFVARWMDRLINVHPSLLPAFRGLNTHARALEAGVRFSGCTVHFVRAEMDDGPIIVQAAVPVLMDDDEKILATRVLEAEHRAYPLAVRLIAEGRVRVANQRVTIAGAASPQRPLLNPVAKSSILSFEKGFFGRR